jgi:hypothetical protein
VQKKIKKIIKAFLKNAYLFFYYTLLVPLNFIYFNYLNFFDKNYERLFKKNTHIFFGYYDVNPISFDGLKILAHALKSDNKTPLYHKKIGLGFFKKYKNKWIFLELTSSYAWSWQMGSRLRWYPNNKSNKIIFNDFSANFKKINSIIFNCNKKTIERKFNFGLYDISKNGKIGLSLDFLRLQKLRPGYGYFSNDNEILKNAPKNTGVFIADLEVGNKKLLFSLEYLSRFQPDLSMNNAMHYVNHLSFAPNGKAFIFIHLWESEGIRNSRLFLYSVCKPKLILLQSEGPISHYTWRNNSNLLIYVKYPGEKTYGLILYNIKTLTYEKIANDLINWDGHPNFNSTGNKIIYDTYPNVFRHQKLFVYDLKERLIKVLKVFKRDIIFSGEVRCDLHPRIDTNNNIVVDDIYKNHRCIGLIRGNKIL